MEDHGKAVCRGKSCPPLGALGAVACGGAVVPMTIASWNARGLFMAVGQCAMPRRKMSVLRALAESDVAIVVESHGEGGDVATLPAEFLAHHVFASYGAHSRMGGIIVLVHRRMLAQCVEALAFEVIQR